MNLALVVVFLSILFMGALVERLFRKFSITWVATMRTSPAVSVTLAPALCAHGLPARDAGAGRLERLGMRAFGALHLLGALPLVRGWAKAPRCGARWALPSSAASPSASCARSPPRPWSIST